MKLPSVNSVNMHKVLMRRTALWQITHPLTESGQSSVCLNYSAGQTASHQDHDTRVRTGFQLFGLCLQSLYHWLPYNRLINLSYVDFFLQNVSCVLNKCCNVSVGIYHFCNIFCLFTFVRSPFGKFSDFINKNHELCLIAG